MKDLFSNLYIMISNLLGALAFDFIYWVLP